MSSSMTIHAGGWAASEEDVRAATIPSATDSYLPVAHGDFLDVTRRLMQEQGLMPSRTQLALAKDGARMFFTIDTQVDGIAGPISMSIGGRNSYDRSMSAARLGGTRVWICDNLAMHAEIIASHKHTTNVWRRLPSRMTSIISRLLERHGDFSKTIERWKAQDLDQKWVDLALMEARRADAIRAIDVPKIDSEWTKPSIPAWETEPESAWRLFNAATQVAKSWTPELQQARTQRLTNAFRKVFGS